MSAGGVNSAALCMYDRQTTEWGTADMDRKMEEALNKQINAELYSAYLYLSMAAYFDSINLGGFSNWMKVQYQEEVEHAMKFYGFVNECSGRVVLEAIKKPETEWDSPLAVFEATYAHEQKVTSMINDLVDLANEVNDHVASEFLQWFVEEQVEEEASADDIVQKLKLVGDSSNELMTLDRALAARGSDYDS